MTTAVTSDETLVRRTCRLCRGPVFESRQIRTAERERPTWQPTTTKYAPTSGEAWDNSLEELQSANAPDARNVIRELDDADTMDGVIVPGWEFVAEELILQIVPRPRTNSPAIPAFWSGTARKSSANRAGTLPVLNAKVRQYAREILSDPFTARSVSLARRLESAGVPVSPARP